MSKPKLEMRLHGQCGPGDVLVKGVEVAQFAADLSQTIERLLEHMEMMVRCPDPLCIECREKAIALLKGNGRLDGVQS